MPVIVKAPNRAGETAVQEVVERDLVPMLPRVRADRQQLNAISMRYWNIWAGRHDSAAYKGRLRAYLTSGRRVIEQWVTMLKRGLFPPSGKWFEVDARARSSEDRAPTVQALFQRFLSDYVQVRRKASPILRGVVILGSQPLDTSWRVSARDVPTLEEVAQEGGNGRSKTRLEETVKRVVSYLGPTLRPVDFFRWYMWPTTVNDLEDADLCFEDFLQEPKILEKLSESPIVPGREKGKGGLGYHIDPTLWKKASDLLPSGDKSDKFMEQRRRLAARGFQSPQNQSAYVPTLDCEKGYWHVQLPGDDDLKWYEFILAGDDIPLRVREVSTGLMGMPTYDVPKFVEVWEEFYGYGLPSAFDSIHYFLNDVLNQGGDALTWSLNPIAAIDPDAIQDHSQLQMKPGAKWLVRMPRASIAWQEPSKESGTVALAAVGQLVGLLNDVGGVQPFAPGGSTTGKGRSIETLGGLQILASEGQLQAADVMQGCEDLWLNKMLRRWHDLTLYCLDEPVLLNVEGVRGAALIETQVTRELLIGEFDFRWLASLYQYNIEVRGMQLGQFLQTVSRIPPELLAQDKTQVRVGQLLRMIWNDGYMLPFAERIFQDTEPVQAIDPSLENDLFRQGRGDEVTVSPADDDDKHIRAHGPLLLDQTTGPEVQHLVMQHVQQHVVAKMAKAMMLAQQTVAGGPMAGMGGGSPGGPSGGPPPNDRLVMPDAPGRIAATAGMDDVARRMPRPNGGIG